MLYKYGYRVILSMFCLKFEEKLFVFRNEALRKGYLCKLFPLVKRCEEYCQCKRDEINVVYKE